MTRHCRGFLTAAAGVALLAAACGDDGDEPAVTAGEPSDVADDPAGPGSVTCLLDADRVSAAVGTDVTLDAMTLGGTGAGGGSASFDADGVEVTTDERSFSVAWQGCTFAADDDMAYLVAELVGEDGNADLTGFDQLVAWAEAGPDTVPAPAVGDEAVVDDDSLVVRDGDRTLVVGFGFGASPEADPAAAVDGFVDMAEALLTFGSDDLVTTCSEAFAAAPAAWGEPGPVLAGGGGGSAGGVEYSYESCSADLPDGGMLEVRIGDRDLFDILAAGAEPDGEVPELITGTGDAAVRMGGNLYVRVGERAFVANAFDSAGEPGDPAAVDALGDEIARTLE